MSAAILALYRLGSFIPVPGVSTDARAGRVLANSDFARDWFKETGGARWKAPGSPRGQAGLEYLAQADLVIAVGCSLAYHAGGGGQLWPKAKMLQIDIDPVAVSQGQEVARHHLRADARLGVEARYRPRNDIEVDGRKLSGTGGFFDGDTLFYQGTVLVDLDARRMVEALNVPHATVRRREGRSIELGGADGARYFDRQACRWREAGIDFGVPVERTLCGVSVPVMPRHQLIEYKERLDREVDRQDVADLVGENQRSAG